MSALQPHNGARRTTGARGATRPPRNLRSPVAAYREQVAEVVRWAERRANKEVAHV